MDDKNVETLLKFIPRFLAYQKNLELFSCLPCIIKNRLIGSPIVDQRLMRDGKMEVVVYSSVFEIWC